MSATSVQATDRGAQQRTLVLINANASGLRRLGGIDAIRELFAAKSGPYEIATTESKAELTRAWPTDPRTRVILVGGDGGVHAAANLPGPAPEIALIPAGRANNVARSLGIPLDTREAAQLALAGRPHPIDLIEAKTPSITHRVVEGLSVGFLASARTRFHAKNSAATLPALWAGARALAAFHPLGVHVSRGEQGLDDLRIAQLFVANLPLYEFGLKVAPQGNPRDGRLEFVAIDAAGRRSIPPMIARLLRGTHLNRPDVHTWRATHARIVAHGRSPIVGDSTDLGSETVEVTSLPGALRIVTPRG